MTDIEAGSSLRRGYGGPHAVATLAFAGLAAACLLTRSTAPAVLGRYSRGLFAFQLANLAALALLVQPSRRERARWLGAVLAVASTFLAPINEAVRQLPGILAILPAVRLLIGWSLVAGEFDRFRRGIRGRGPVMAAGFALVALSILDLTLWGWVASTSGFDEDYEGLRDRYDLRDVGPGDIVLVGDSFVWGHGVAKSERFGNVIEGLYRREGRSTRVFSLGVRGAGPVREIEALDRLPADRRAGAVVLAFYPNDIAPRPEHHSKILAVLEKATLTLGRSSLAFRGVHDLLGRIESPTLERYHRSLVDDYRLDDETFAARWGDLTASLGRFAGLARSRSVSRPVLLILPLMVDFRAYPLADAHAALRDEAERLGFDVLDVLDDFRSRLVDGTRFRVRPDDNHFDARVHALVAALLKQYLDERRGGGPPTAPR